MSLYSFNSLYRRLRKNFVDHFLDRRACQSMMILLSNVKSIQKVNVHIFHIQKETDWDMTSGAEQGFRFSGGTI